MQIAIDGPAGAGKSTAARRVARRLGIIYIDTGAMYRAVGLYAFNNGADVNDSKALEALLPRVEIDCKVMGGEQRLYLNGEDVTGALRTPQAGMNASAVAKHLKVREFLVALQQRLAAGKDVAMDGRDIGSVVLPDATLKVYLEAGLNNLYERRRGELDAKGIEYDPETLRREVEARVYNDRARENSPDKPADGAFIINTDDMDAQAVEDRIIELLDSLGK